MTRSVLFIILAFLVIPASFIAVAKFSESDECMELLKELQRKSELVLTAKKSGDTGQAKLLASKAREWMDTTFKTEMKRLECDQKGELASDIQRMSILPIFVFGCGASWFFSGRVFKQKKP